MCFRPIRRTNKGIEGAGFILPCEYIEAIEGHRRPGCMQESYSIEFKLGKEEIKYREGNGQ